MEDKKGVDIISLIQSDHSNFLEKDDYLNKLLFDFLNKDLSWGKEDVKEFLALFINIILRHFEDEADLVKLLEKKMDVTDNKIIMINAFIQEHETIKKRIGQINIALNDYKPQVREVKENLKKNAHEILELVTKHAQKEDVSLFPLARELLTKSDLEQLQNTVETRKNMRK